MSAETSLAPGDGRAPRAQSITSFGSGDGPALQMQSIFLLSAAATQPPRDRIYGRLTGVKGLRSLRGARSAPLTPDSRQHVSSPVDANAATDISEMVLWFSVLRAE